MSVAHPAPSTRADLDAFAHALRAVLHDAGREDHGDGVAGDDVRRRILVRMLRRTAQQAARSRP